MKKSHNKTKQIQKRINKRKQCSLSDYDGYDASKAFMFNDAELRLLVKQMLEIYNKVEVSESSGREFFTTTINSCHHEDASYLRRIFMRMEEIVGK